MHKAICQHFPWNRRDPNRKTSPVIGDNVGRTVLSLRKPLMSVQYTILTLFDAIHGSLVEIQTSNASPAGDMRQWLWIEGGVVTWLPVVAESTTLERFFDRAVLTQHGDCAELKWTGGKRDVLVLYPDCKLRPSFHSLLHQHLN